eukprot:TRINITY_DN3698_c0_g2_i7.p1 TRINITY_DN3698_c0_g2~~TRINITY_DN3698_c0_g2_i7.p1  ORF type:complete len:629 (-),score=83.54 TRINITY_DN3698_c0_g2_i7:703-2418(-)
MSDESQIICPKSQECIPKLPVISARRIADIHSSPESRKEDDDYTSDESQLVCTLSQKNTKNRQQLTSKSTKEAQNISTTNAREEDDDYMSDESQLVSTLSQKYTKNRQQLSSKSTEGAINVSTTNGRIDEDGVTNEFLLSDTHLDTTQYKNDKRSTKNIPKSPFRFKKSNKENAIQHVKEKRWLVEESSPKKSPLITKEQRSFVTEKSPRSVKDLTPKKKVNSPANARFRFQSKKKSSSELNGTTEHKYHDLSYDSDDEFGFLSPRKPFKSPNTLNSPHSENKSLSVTVKSGNTTPSTGKSPSGKFIFRKLYSRANETTNSPSGRKNTPLRESKGYAAREIMRSPARKGHDFSAQRFDHKENDASAHRQENILGHRNSIKKNDYEEKFYTEGITAIEVHDMEENLTPSFYKDGVPGLKNSPSVRKYDSNGTSKGFESNSEMKSETTSDSLKAATINSPNGKKEKSVGPQEIGTSSDRSEFLVDSISENPKIENSGTALPSDRLECSGCEQVTQYARALLHHQEPSELRGFLCDDCLIKNLHKDCECEECETRFVELISRWSKLEQNSTPCS